MRRRDGGFPGGGAVGVPAGAGAGRRSGRRSGGPEGGRRGVVGRAAQRAPGKSGRANRLIMPKMNFLKFCVIHCAFDGNRKKHVCVFGISTHFCAVRRRAGGGGAGGVPASGVPAGVRGGVVGASVGASSGRRSVGFSVGGRSVGLVLGAPFWRSVVARRGGFWGCRDFAGGVPVYSGV